MSETTSPVNYKFTKKPVRIEAFQMTRERRVDNVDWPEWLHAAWNEDPGAVGAVFPTIPVNADGVLSIRTLEGEMTVAWDSWIIQGVQGELYACKPDIFSATYTETP